MWTQLLLTECTGEFLGTWLLVFLGTATVTTAVTTGAQVGLWQTASVWGIAMTLAISVASQVSDAHLNPAVTISLAVSRQTRFPVWKLFPYIISQLLGATLSGFCVLQVYGSAIARYEAINYITRGEANSTLSAMVFGEYFPNPQIVWGGALREQDVTPLGAMLVEAVGTMVLVLMIRTLTDEKNKSRPPPQHVAIYVGITVAALVSVFAPLSQAGFNPARDFGPRLVAALAGWNTIALPGPRGGFWVYILGPVFGGVVGSLLYDFAVFPSLVEVRTMKEKFEATSPHAEQPVEISTEETRDACDVDMDVMDASRVEAGSPHHHNNNRQHHCTSRPASPV